jgi:hypothetical protein
MQLVNIWKQEPKDGLKYSNERKTKERNHQSITSSPAFFQFLFDFCAEVVV